MSDPEYAPFPAEGLESCALFFEDTALDYAKFGIDSAGVLLVSARICRDAIASYKALNERCLRAELALNHGIKEPAS